MIEEAADHEEIEDGEAVSTPGDKIDFLFFWTLMAPYPVGCSHVANHIYLYVKEGISKQSRIFKFKENINWKKIQWWDSTVIYCAYLSKVLSKISLHSLYALGYPIWRACPHSLLGYIYKPCFAVRATSSYAIGRGSKTREPFFARLWSVYDLTLHSIVALTLLNLSEYHT